MDKKFCVCCETREQVESVLELFEKKGYLWQGGEKPTGFVPRFEDKLYLFVEELITFGREWDEEYPIVSAKKYLKKFSDETIVIYRSGQSVIAKDKSTGKTATVKCHPADEFDFKAYAKLALDWLIEEEKPKFEPTLKDEIGTNFGKIGEPTNLKDGFGRSLFVGDLVKIIGPDDILYGEEFVVMPIKSTAFVMGIKCDCKGGNNYSNKWIVLKVKDYKDVSDSEKHGVISAILK